MESKSQGSMALRIRLRFLSKTFKGPICFLLASLLLGSSTLIAEPPPQIKNNSLSDPAPQPRLSTKPKPKKSARKIFELKSQGISIPQNPINIEPSDRKKINK